MRRAPWSAAVAAADSKSKWQPTGAACVVQQGPRECARVPARLSSVRRHGFLWRVVFCCCFPARMCVRGRSVLPLLAAAVVLALAAPAFAQQPLRWDWYQQQGAPTTTASPETPKPSLVSSEAAPSAPAAELQPMPAVLKAAPLPAPALPAPLPATVPPPAAEASLPVVIAAAAEPATAGASAQLAAEPTHPLPAPASPPAPPASEAAAPPATAPAVLADGAGLAASPACACTDDGVSGGVNTSAPGCGQWLVDQGSNAWVCYIRVRPAGSRRVEGSGDWGSLGQRCCRSGAGAPAGGAAPFCLAVPLVSVLLRRATDTTRLACRLPACAHRSRRCAT